MCPWHAFISQESFSPPRQSLPSWLRTTAATVEADDRRLAVPSQQWIPCVSVQSWAMGTPPPPTTLHKCTNVPEECRAQDPLSCRGRPRRAGSQEPVPVRHSPQKQKLSLPGKPRMIGFHEKITSKKRIKNDGVKSGTGIRIEKNTRTNGLSTCQTPKSVSRANIIVCPRGVRKWGLESLVNGASVFPT